MLVKQIPGLYGFFGGKSGLLLVKIHSFIHSISKNLLHQIVCQAVLEVGEIAMKKRASVLMRLHSRVVPDNK